MRQATVYKRTCNIAVLYRKPQEMGRYYKIVAMLEACEKRNSATGSRARHLAYARPKAQSCHCTRKEQLYQKNM